MEPNHKPAVHWLPRALPVCRRRRACTNRRRQWWWWWRRWWWRRAVCGSTPECRACTCGPVPVSRCGWCHGSDRRRTGACACTRTSTRTGMRTGTRTRTRTRTRCAVQRLHQRQAPRSAAAGGATERAAGHHRRSRSRSAGAAGGGGGGGGRGGRGRVHWRQSTRSKPGCTRGRLACVPRAGVVVCHCHCHCHCHPPGGPGGAGGGLLSLHARHAPAVRRLCGARCQHAVPRTLCHGVCAQRHRAGPPAGGGSGRGLLRQLHHHWRRVRWLRRRRGRWGRLHAAWPWQRVWR